MAEPLPDDNSEQISVAMARAAAQMERRQGLLQGLVVGSAVGVGVAAGVGLLMDGRIFGMALAVIVGAWMWMGFGKAGKGS